MVQILIKMNSISTSANLLIYSWIVESLASCSKAMRCNRYKHIISKKKFSDIHYSTLSAPLGLFICQTCYLRRGGYVVYRHLSPFRLPYWMLHDCSLVWLYELIIVHFSWFVKKKTSFNKKSLQNVVFSYIMCLWKLNK